ncbi:MAG: VF530 family protein [Methylotenera sp.]
MKPPATALPHTPDNQPELSRPKQHNNPLHGLTLEAIVTALEMHFGWAGLAEQIPVRCFSNEPSISSSLKFLRKTPWAREKVEALYIFMVQDINQTEIVERPNSVE